MVSGGVCQIPARNLLTHFESSCCLSCKSPGPGGERRRWGSIHPPFPAPRRMIHPPWNGGGKTGWFWRFGNRMVPGMVDFRQDHSHTDMWCQRRHGQRVLMRPCPRHRWHQLMVRWGRPKSRACSNTPSNKQKEEAFVESLEENPVPDHPTSKAPASPDFTLAALPPCADRPSSGAPGKPESRNCSLFRDRTAMSEGTGQEIAMVRELVGL